MLGNAGKLRHCVALPHARDIVWIHSELAAQPRRIVGRRARITTTERVGGWVIGCVRRRYSPRAIVRPLWLGLVERVMLACRPVGLCSFAMTALKRWLTACVFEAAAVAKGTPCPLCSSITLHIEPVTRCTTYIEVRMQRHSHQSHAP